MTDKSRAAIKLNCKVLGIGVAVSVSTSILALSERIFSFTATMWVDGYFNIFQLLVLAVLLLFSFYLQSQLNYGIFPKWDYCAKLFTFPFFVVLRVLGYCIGKNVGGFGDSNYLPC